jgi:2,4-dienoyl-CoA reductase-like NADH-dependent reductase (Old Yellow Enzyme family)
MAKIFEQTKIKSMTLKNRLVRSATHEGMSDENGLPTEALFRFYARLARGGVGLITTGYAYISKEGETLIPGMKAIHNDDCIPKYRELTELVHRYDTAFVMQIVHGGMFGAGSRPLAPSSIKNLAPGVDCKEMSHKDIERTIRDFSYAAKRVKESGFDGVQIHAAHGMLGTQFMSPRTNLRTDDWGGSVEKRTRFLVEVCKGCRTLVGEDFPILIKISAYDRFSDGLKPEDTILMAQILAEAGYDGIEVSCGIGGKDRGSIVYGQEPYGKRPRQAFNREVAKDIKGKVNIPVFVVGGITDPIVMEDVIKTGDADYISMARALIAQPNFPKSVMAGNFKPASCIQCNLCYGYLSSQPLRCYHGKKLIDQEPMLKEILLLKTKSQVNQNRIK